MSGINGRRSGAIEPQEKNEVVEMQGRETEWDKVMVQHQERIRDEDKGPKGPMALIGYLPPYLYIYKELWTYLM